MNLGLFRSRHAVYAAALVGVFAVWSIVDGVPLGRASGPDSAFLLWSGWIGLAVFVVLAAYALRKSAHRTGLTPEFGMAVSIENIERAQDRISQGVRAPMQTGSLRSRRRILRLTHRILRDEGVHRVVRPVVRRASDHTRSYELHLEPRNPLGRLAAWMHVHLFYGIAAAFLVWFHGGLEIGTPMGLLLNGLSYIVIGTGVIGIVCWVFGPTWLTRCETDLSIERVHALRQHYARKLGLQRTELDSLEPACDAGWLAELDSGMRRGRFDADRFFRAAPEPRSQSIRDVLVLAGQRDAIEREWSRLSRTHHLLNVWRIVHVPSSIVLMCAVFVHVASVLWY